MDFKVENFIPARHLEVLRSSGLHKVAGAMANVDELTVKEAVGIIGAKAFLRRKESQKIAEGLQALADLTGEKIANPLLSEALQRAMPMALGGAAIATVPKLLSNEPVDAKDLLSSGALGALMGGVGSAGMSLNRAGRLAPGANQEMANALHMDRNLGAQ